MNFSVNNYSPAFKGIYVVEGTGKEVKEFEEMIREHYEFSQQVPENINMEDRISNRKFLSISGLYGDEQPCAKLLVTTNEDCHVIWSWDRKYNKPIRCPHVSSPFIDSPYKRQKQKKLEQEQMSEIIAYTKKMISECNDKMAEYNYAMRDGEDALLDFIEKINKESATILEQLKEFTPKKIKIFKFKDLMQAIKEDRFNIATGKMKTKIKL